MQKPQFSLFALQVAPMNFQNEISKPGTTAWNNWHWVSWEPEEVRPPRNSGAAERPLPGPSPLPALWSPRRLSGCPRVTRGGRGSSGPSRRSSAPARSPRASISLGAPSAKGRGTPKQELSKKKPGAAHPLLRPSESQRSTEARPPTSTPETSGQPWTVWVAAPPAAGGWPQSLRSGGWLPRLQAGRCHCPELEPSPPSSRPGTSASGIHRDPPPPRLPIGCGNQLVSGGGNGEVANEISDGRLRRCGEVGTGPANPRGGAEAGGWAGPRWSPRTESRHTRLTVGAAFPGRSCLLSLPALRWASALSPPVCLWYVTTARVPSRG